MISIAAVDENKKERDLLHESCWKIVSVRKDEDMTFQSADSDDAFEQIVGEKTLLNLLYYEFRSGQSVETLRRFRRKYLSSQLMLIADTSVSPLEYLKPGVAPDSLLLRPYRAEDLNRINREFMASYFEKYGNGETEGTFAVDTREEKIMIPYGQIYYFEARDKKLFVRTQKDEYAFYDTIDSLEEKLPSGFRRCHRSYIVNVSKIRKVIFTENTIELENKIGVPVSRSYKPAFKGEK